MPVVFASRSLPPAERRVAWESLLAREFDGLRLIDADTPLRAEVTAGALGPGARAVHLTGSAQHVSRESGDDATSSTCNLLIQRQGRCRVRHRGDTYTLEAGQLALIDGRHGFELQLEQPFDQWLLRLPRGLVVERLPHLDRGPIGPTTADPLDTYVHRLAVDAAETALRIEPGHQGLVDVLLAALPLLSALRPPEHAASSTVTRARGVLALHAHDPGLDPAAIAARLRVGRRHLEQAFAAEGTTVARETWALRLDRAAAALSRRDDHRSVLAIALGCGFTSPAHFARVFRARFGVSPTQHRRAKAR